MVAERYRIGPGPLRCGLHRRDQDQPQSFDARRPVARNQLTEAARLGDMVLICPEEPIAHRYLGAGTCKSGSEPMLKPVAATAGDMVSVSAAGIAVNGELLPHTSAKTRDGAGRPLQPFAVGEYKVGAGELWAVAPHDWSYDSRYLGPIPALWLIAKASPVLLWGYHDKEGDTWQTSLQLRF